MVAPKNNALSWDHPKGSGIKIREMVNETGGYTYNGSYQVVVPAKLTGTVRKRKQFKTKEKAKQWAINEFRGFQKQGEGYFEATPKERNELAVCLPKLRKQGITLTEAVEFAIKRLRPEGGEKTIGQIVDEIVSSKKTRYERGDLREKSFLDFRQRAVKFKEVFEDTPAKALSVEEIKDWLLGMQKSPRTTKNYLSIISEILKHATQKRYLFFSPLDELTDSDRKELCGNNSSFKEPDILTTDEAERLLLAAYNQPELDLLGAVVLGLFCGIRTEELKRIKWSNVKYLEDQPVVTISGDIAKKRRIRHVDIPENAISWLLRCESKSGQVVRNKYHNEYHRKFKRLLENSGFGALNENGKWVTNWSINAMRHSFGTYHFAKYGNSLETSRLLGHKANDEVLFDHYRALATKRQAENYFSIKPPQTKSKIVELTKASIA